MIKRRRLIWQLYPSYLLLVLIALLAIGWYASGSMRLMYISKTRQDLSHQAHLLAMQFLPLLKSLDRQAVDRLCKQIALVVPTRLTIILPDGVVIGDSEAAPPEMENHGDRPEIQQAFQGEVGTSLRFSDTLHQRMMYVAVPMEENEIVGVVRVSIAVTAIEDQLHALQLRLALGGLIIALLASVICLVISRRISRPIETMRRGAAQFAQGDLRHRLQLPETVELAGLAQAMNQMAHEIEIRLQTIERQRNESQAVLSSMVEGVMALDPEERIIHLNEAAARLLEDRPALLQGRNVQEVIRNRALHKMVQTTIEEGTTTQEDIVLFQSGDRILNTRCTAMLDANGQRIGALLVMNEVTQLRRLERMRSDFAANVSHEIKTPLTAIKGYVETLREGSVDDTQETRRFLDIINKHVYRLTAIIDDLMHLSRLEQGSEDDQLRLTVGPIAHLLRTSTHLCQNKAEEKQVSISVTCPDELTARMDADLMAQAVVNLLDNAIKYSPAGSRVVVTAKADSKEIQIRFQDMGVGIAKKHLPRLFERFYRVDKARSRKMGGTGLGLAIVKHIVQAHKGLVTVESTPGQGSTFTIHLPLPPLTTESPIGTNND